MVKVGCIVKINVPCEVYWKVKDFWVKEIYRNGIVLLTDGIINVSYTKWDLEHLTQPIKGEWN